MGPVTLGGDQRGDHDLRLADAIPAGDRVEGGQDAQTALVEVFADIARAAGTLRDVCGRAVIGASFRDDVANAPQGEMEVRAEGVAGKLYFDVTDAAAVFAALEDCAKTLR
jgi:hypothetical protein